MTGMVDEPFELTYAELSDLDIVEADITMTCISNQVGGDLVGNARWLGVLTRDLLDRARPQGRGRPARRPLDRRLHVRLPDRGRLRPAVPRRHRHERRAAAAASRLPGPARDARASTATSARPSG